MIERFFLGFVHDAVGKTYPVTTKLPKDEKDLLLDIKDSINFLINSDDLSASPTDLCLSFVDALESDVISEIDKLPASYFILSPKDKDKVLTETLSKKGLMWDALRSTLKSCSYEELQSELSQLVLRTYPDRSSLLVQSARSCDASLKSEIREHYRDKSFILFSINHDLLGGIRVYRDSALVDSSWLGRIASI